MISIRPDAFLFLMNGKLIAVEEFPHNLYAFYKPVYEVIKFRNHLHYFEEHLKRMEFSLNKIGVDAQEIRLPSQAEIEILFEKNKISEGNVRIDVFMDKKIALAYLIPHFFPPPAFYQTGISMVFQHEERQNQNIKLFDAVIKNHTKQLLEKQQVFETLLINRMGAITEGSRSNIFFIKNSVVYTPLDYQVLLGITRQNMIKFLEEQMIELIKKNIFTNELGLFDAAFITGTSIDALPINRIENHTFDSNNKLLMKIINGFNPK